MIPEPLTRIGFAPRAAGLTPEECQAHWRSAHADAAGALPGLRRYVQNHAILRDGLPLLPYPGFDVCSELQWDDLAAMDAAFASEQYRGAVTEDEGRLIDKRGFAFALGERRVLRDGEDDAVKLMTFLRRHPGADGDAFERALGGAFREAGAAGGALRHEQIVVSDAAHDGRPSAPFDAVDILWFASPHDAVAFAAGEAAQTAGFRAAGVVFGAERLVARPIVVVEEVTKPTVG